MKKLFGSLFLALLIALGIYNAPTIAQNVSMVGTFIQYSGLGVGQAPTGVTGGIVAPIYSSGSNAVVQTAATIAPTNGIQHVSAAIAATTISTITVPATCSPTCAVTLIPDGGWVFSNTTGNIALGTTSVTNRALIMTWDGTSWKPSY